jgi:hypothetical protein
MTTSATLLTGNVASSQIGTFGQPFRDERWDSSR